MQNIIEKYQMVGTILKSNRKNTILSVQFQNVIEKYQTLGTILKSKSKIQHCRYNSKI
jgi:hypothetical protein